MTPRGKFVWFELLTTDVEAAIAFYTEVLGWKTQAWQGIADMPYTMWCVGERPIGGVMTLPAELGANGVPPHWFGHVAVPDADATSKLAVELGGELVHSEDVPEVGRFAILKDPQGAVLSAFTPKDEVVDEPPAIGDFSWKELNTTDYSAAWPYYAKLFGWQETKTHEMGGAMGAYFMFAFEGAGRTVGGMCNSAKVKSLPPH